MHPDDPTRPDLKDTPPASAPPPPQPAEPETDDPDDEMIVLGAGIDWHDPKFAPYSLRMIHVAGLFLLAVVWVLLTYSYVWHTDVWAHLRFGEYMVRNGQFPAHETFSGDFADQEAPYVNYQWVAQAGAYLLFDAGRRLGGDDEDVQLGAGALMLSTAHGAFIVLRLALLWWAFRRLTGSDGWALAGVGVSTFLAALYHLFILRPQILGEAAFAALLVPLSRSPISRRAVVLIPLVFLLWANCHGSFPIGLALLAFALAGQALDAARGAWRGGVKAVVAAVWHDLGFQRLLAAFVLSIGAVTINPHGPMLIWYSWKLSNHPNIMTMSEWGPLVVRSTSGYLFLGTVLVLAFALRRSRAPLTAIQVLLLLLFGLQTLAHSRVFVWWSMVFVWTTLPHLQSAVERSRATPREPASPPAVDFRLTLLGIAVVLITLMWSAPMQWLISGQPPTAKTKLHPLTPYEVSRYLKAHLPTDREATVFTSETMGDYLFWDLRREPNVRVACYTHAHLFTPGHWRDCMGIKGWQPGARSLLDRLPPVEYIVVEAEGPIADGNGPQLRDWVRAHPEEWEVLSSAPIFLARRKHVNAG